MDWQAQVSLAWVIPSGLNSEVLAQTPVKGNKPGDNTSIACLAWLAEFVSEPSKAPSEAVAAGFDCVR